MTYRHAFLLLVTNLLWMGTGPANSKADDSEVFEREVAPLLIKRCVECHQGKHPSGGLLLTTSAGILQGGDSGAALDKEAPGDSLLLSRVHEGEMPPEEKGQPKPLSEEETNVLERWVKGGAFWPQGRTLDLFERTNDVRGGRDLWSLQPVRRPTIPKLNGKPQSIEPQNPIDAFIGAQLKREGMTSAPTASKRVLIRRLYFDLVGLPPTQSQIAAFEQDETPQAWEKLIDELLESPQYGERWGRYWLDLVRYADTSGYERDQEKPFAWKYRDWVVNAFNTDMPYDRFILEQLAGDEIPDRTEDSVIATGFLRLGTWNDEPNDPLDYQYDRLEDLVHTTSSSFLAITVKCARCHDHKFDPVTQEDYYRMGAAFWGGPIAARERKFLGGPSPEELGVTEVLGWTDLGQTPSPLHVLMNGEREVPMYEVIPASLSMIPALDRPFQPPPETAKTTHRRLQLAQWIGNPENPLTARVFVNRLWQHHFGQGIVRTPNNFGFLADPATHPELLDWLADEFVSGGWTTKRMHKLILTSQTWRQASTHPQQEEYSVKDSGNRLWWRSERRRLDAEALRDSMLAVTGELDLRVGGPGFRPSIRAEALEGLSRKTDAWQPSSKEEQARRTLYLFSQRSLLPPMMTTFNFPDATQSCAQRDITTVPTQALVLMNNPFVHARSDRLATTILEGLSSSQAENVQNQVQQLWVSVYGRAPTTDEIEIATKHLSVQRHHFDSLSEAKEDSSIASSPAGLALASLAHVLLNSNEFVYVD
ncbi:Planctomycete cytochrome C [Roseimaritima multifibrata]|uniref:Planctomycete cytochrome C n=1 Tax=Roseimaritima multifibrata TaxID=1930274 RepID=A0A517MGJ9_9BACT|nr:PSD1 and planctomycete cytochrome C domain-containing protein [Roseimaritima multifibrata]QDS94005.1 Planctomycete cytochrome C [Roseimaritima multifibrata]